MTKVYSNPEREHEPHALPNIEVFFHDGQNTITFDNGVQSHFGMTTGWYWWVCFPGCLPDGEPVGPFETESEAIQNAQDC